MIVNPMARDIDPAAYPDIVMFLHMIQKSLQCGKPTWPANDSAM
jgi:hypothetical protein